MIRPRLPPRPAPPGLEPRSGHGLPRQSRGIRAVAAVAVVAVVAALASAGLSTFPQPAGSRPARVADAVGVPPAPGPDQAAVPQPDAELGPATTAGNNQAAADAAGALSSVGQPGATPLAATGHPASGPPAASNRLRPRSPPSSLRT